MPSITDIAIDYGGGAVGGVAPQFIGLDSRILQEHLDRAVAVHNASYFGTVWNQAMALYASHTLALAFPAVAQGGSGSGSGAAITSKKAGDLSVTYTAQGSATTGDALDLTPWGQQFKAIRRGRRRAPRYVSGF